MKRDDILKLRTNGNYPSVSILMQTHKTFPESKQDQIKLKNLAIEAKRRLESEFERKLSDSIVTKIDTAIEELDFNFSERGLALFADKNSADVFSFPFPVKDRVIIDKTFATRDVVFAFNRTQPYYVIVINEKQTNIYYCTREDISGVKHPELPLSNYFHEIKDGEIKDESFNDKNRINEERQKNYLREVDKIFKEVRGEAETPAVITGTPKQIAMFKEVTRSPKLIAGTVQGSYEKFTPAEIVKLAWPEFKKAFAEKRSEVLSEVEKAAGAKKLAIGIDEVWKLAHEGRGLTLVTEINFAFPAKLGDSGQLIHQEDHSLPGVIDDAVDEIIEAVVSKGGHVVFFDNGKLDNYDKIALILRY